MYAKKSLGQHFLKSERALQKIIEVGNIIPGETILEIGPGRGALTERLLTSDCKLIAIEKDDDLYQNLMMAFEKEISDQSLKLIHEDILKFDLNKLQATSYKLIANIPYNITGAILEKFLSANNQPNKMVLLVQDEVAKRIVERDGKGSILSVSVKAYGKPRYIERVLAGSFAPAPKVDSAILVIEDISKDFFKDFSEKEFFQILKAGFQSKRKKLSSNLSTQFDKNLVQEVFQRLNLDPNTRAEELDVEIWGKIGKLIYQGD